MSGRKLTCEERMLWSRVARSTRPLHGRELEEEPATSEPAPEKAAGRGVGSIRRSGRAGPAAAASAVPRTVPVLNPIEWPVKRKIATGRLALEASLDLHGLMQAEAHDLLLAFLSRAHERGLRHVLVITGKGASHGSEGVLRRAVPQWLAKPGFRRLVSGCETAARLHGGEGALYIRLKRRPGGGE